MANKIITISREFGSGGRTIGKLAAEKLGIPCYDAELIEKIAEESGFTPEYVKEESESSAGGWLSAFFQDYSAGLSNQDKLWTIQCKIIEDIAQKESCVIIGRCADYVLQDKADCLNVFIHADDKMRAQRIVERYGERDESPEKRLKEKDKRRAAYRKYYTDLKWGDAKDFHLCLDASKFSIETCADIIARLY